MSFSGLFFYLLEGSSVLFRSGVLIELFPEGSLIRMTFLNMSFQPARPSKNLFAELALILFLFFIDFANFLTLRTGEIHQIIEGVLNVLL